MLSGQLEFRFLVVIKAERLRRDHPTTYMAVFALPRRETFSMRILMAALTARARFAIFRRMTLAAVLRVVLAPQFEPRGVMVKRGIFERARRRVAIITGARLEYSTVRALVTAGAGARTSLTYSHLAATMTLGARDGSVFTLERNPTDLAVIERHLRGAHAAFHPGHMAIGATLAQSLVGKLVRIAVARDTAALEPRERGPTRFGAFLMTRRTGHIRMHATQLESGAIVLKTRLASQTAPVTDVE